MRIGNDLIISGDGQKFVVGNYFKGEARPVLATKDGATLAGHIVDALTGHVHYAQAAPAAPAGEVIGHVQKMSGSATVIRNGVSVELRIGDAVQKGDVVQTGSDSSIGMTFVDGSVFGMTSNARMVLNEMIFDPNGSSNSSLISLVQGTITFVAGQTAKNGNMRVETPVATMGIRGTAVLVEIGANDGPTKFSVLVEPDGHTGSYNLYDKTTGQLIGTVSQAGQVTYVSVSGIGQPPTAIEQLKTLADQEAAKALIQEVFKLYFPNYNPDANPKSQKTGFGSPSDNLNPFAFYKPQDIGPPKVITIPGVGYDPVTGQPNPPRTFYNTKAQFWTTPVFADQAFSPTIRVFSFKDVVTIDDPDIGNAPFYDIGVPFVAGSAIITSAVSTVGYLSEAFLKPLLNINQTTGVVSFDREQFNFLDDGQTVTFKIQVTATSGPDTGIVEIPITVTGANDAPIIVVGAPTVADGTVKEDTNVASGHIATDGIITFQDVDLTDAHTATVELTSTSSTLPGFVSGAGNAPTTTKIGTFTIDPVSESTTDTSNQGSVGWHFSLDDNDPVLQSLAEGQTITQVYTITIIDDNGVPVEQDVTITITGTNDAPALTVDTAIHPADEVTDTTGAPNSVVDVATGTLAFTDVDLSDTHTASAALHPGASSVVWSGGNYNDIPQATRDALNAAVTATVSESTTDTNNQGSVAWEFKLPDHLFDFLAHGETLTLIYDVTVIDDNGAPSTQQVTVVVEAANDQPVISVIDNGAAIKEDIDAVSDILKDTGTVTFTDTDLTDTHTAHVVYNNDAAGSAGVSPALALALATALTVPASALAAGDHDFNWDFALDTNLIQYLAEGETITATYTITVGDNSNSSNDTSAGQVVTVVITGTNDAPTITSGISAASATVPELAETTGSTSLDTAGGTVTFNDVDLTDTHEVTQSTATFAWSGGTLTPTQINDLTSASSRTLVPNDSTGTGSGSIDWTYKITDSALDFLADGQTLTVTYDITVADYNNSVATGTSTSQTVTITYTGSNDVPIVSAAVSDALVVEDGSVSVLNALANASDADNGATLSVVDVPGTLPAGVTYDAVNHTFTLDPNNAAYQYLADGVTTIVTVNYGVSDGIVTTPTPASVSWTITGTNDAPELNGDDVTVAEIGDGSPALPYGTTKVFGITLSDPDEAGSLTVSATAGDGTVSGVSNGTVDAITGNFTSGITYTPNNTVPNANDMVTLIVTDSQGASDTLHFVFQQNGTGGATLTGTTGKDLIFSTEGDDTLTGLGGRDNFVFAPSSGHDTIMDFTSGTDRIDFKALSGMDATALANLLATADHTGGDTLLHINGTTDTLLVKGVAVLNASDFILHA